MGALTDTDLQLMTVREVAELFRRRERTVREWLRDGDVFPGAVKIRGGWLVPRHIVIRVLHSGRVVVHSDPS
jgi:hypothetical protein